MALEIFLIASETDETDALAARLEAALGDAPAAALLIASGMFSDDDYLARVEPLIGIAHRADCAVLLDNRPYLVKSSGADGVHMTGGIKALREAVGLLKPDHIVGTGDIGSRHEAMVRGELDIDYLMFGDRPDPDIDGRAMADWWADTFEVPSVYRARAGEDAIDTVKSEFVAFADADWGRVGGLKVRP